MYRRALKVSSQFSGIAWSTRSMAAGSIQLVGFSSLSPTIDMGSGTGDTKGIRTFRGSSARGQFQIVEETGFRSFATGGMSSKRPIPEKVVIFYHKADVDDFIAVADAIEEEFPHVIVEGEETRLRKFEVYAVDVGRLVFSCQAPRKPDIDSVVFIMRNIGMADADLSGVEVPGGNPCH